jgi:putative oxidoreductase
MNRDKQSDSTAKQAPAANAAGAAQREPISESIGKLILRVTLGGLMLLHGIAKLRNGIDGVADMLDSSGLPTGLAYGVYIGEVIAPVLLILGLWTRIAAIIFAFNMLVAILIGHANEIFSLNQFGGWAIELPALFLLAAISVALLGPGRICVGKSTGICA